METRWRAIGLVILCTVFTSAGQILWKFGSEQLSFDISSIILNVPLILGLLSYGVALFFLILAFRGGELSVLYPIVATSYIWVSIASPFFFETDYMTLSKWAGIIIIITGVSLIGWGAKK
jgi:undecaprenyl phosphate-alpha-L-ara4N flippase subunit ArnE